MERCPVWCITINGFLDERGCRMSATMEPRIQYARTTDGYSIAFTVSGSGPPLLHMPQPVFSTVQARAAIPAYRALDQRIEQSFRVVRYDSRGCGLSTRKIDNLRLDELLRDAEAVVDKLGLEEFSIFAEFDSGPPAIAIAHRYPDRVKKLVLWCSWARSLDVLDKDAWLALNQLLDYNLQLYLETIVQGSVSGTGLDPREVVQPVLSGVDQASLKIAVTDFWSLDVSELVGELKCPCLVMHRQGLFFPAEQSARLAAAIPDGRLIVLPGPGGVPWAGETGPVIDALEEFLLPEREKKTPLPSAFRTILFTDLVGHTEMMSRLGDERGRAVLRDHERITRDVLKAHGGTEVKTMGDGFMASFGSVTRAVESAIALQRAFAERNSSARSEALEGLSVRVGLNAGEPIEEEGDLFGATVILASRIAAKAEGGEILVADTVRGLCSGKGFLFADRGEFVAKGFEEPVRVFEVRWRE
jgi:class 3 adenylate cyclase/pimeloyl-ACP methyl ester carboxylesterase